MVNSYRSESTSCEVTKMKKLELVFVPFPVVGHLVPIVEFGRVLVGRDDRFSVTLLIMKGPIGPIPHPEVTNYIHSISAACFSGSIRFVHLPQLDGPDSSISNSSSSSPTVSLHNFMERQKLLVRDAVHQLMIQSETGRLTGIVVDSFCSSIMDVGDELGVPSYVFVTSSAASVALMFHLQTLHDHHGVDLTEFADSDTELVVPGFVNSVPARVLPALWVEKEGSGGSVGVLGEARRARQAKGILVNTVLELESHVIDSFVDGTTPPVYTVGPLLNSNHGDDQKVIRWLDDQPPSSVLFLCFGSIGALNKDQVKNIAISLENSGYHFLWTLRRPPPKGTIADTSDYTDFKQVLPQEFLDRTSKIGKIIRWVPQAAVLAHPAIGGFISHCGWNSILESIWYGVPIATWPMFAEQQLNAFRLVKELEIGIEIKLDYNNYTNNDIISAQEIESKITNLMGDSYRIKKKMAWMKEMCRKALIEGGSSNSNIQRLIGDMMISFS